MRVVLQRVSHASVKVDGTITGRIGRGILLLLGVHQSDERAQAEILAEKCADLRIFPDSEGKMNLSAKDLGLGALVVSQFTLYGDCRKGRRPNFMSAAAPPKATELYEYFVECMKRHLPLVQTGIFGAIMEVELVNDGPVTLLLERTSENVEPA
jgi:D-tyrosyl-tRNA(Tyr) deacylase